MATQSFISASVRTKRWGEYFDVRERTEYDGEDQDVQTGDNNIEIIILSLA